MHTADVLRADGKTTPRTHVCQCGCGRVFEHRSRGGNKYYSRACNSRYGGRGRTIRFRLNHGYWSELTPKGMLDFVRQRPSSFKSPQITTTWEELNKLDQSLLVHGTRDATLRQEIKQKAENLRKRLETLELPNADELRQYVRALEILRDVGSETRVELRLRRTQAWAVVQYYLHHHDDQNLARALHTFGNVCRLLGDKRAHHEMTRCAFDLLKEYRGPVSDRHLLMLHQASYWDLRSCVQGYGDSQAIDRFQRVMDLAKRIDTPMVWLQTWQELAGYYGMRGAVDQAKRAISALNSLRRSLEPQLLDVPTTLRAEIELYVDHDKNQAVHLIERKYLPAVRMNPRALFIDNLKSWKPKLGIALPNDLPKPYETPIFNYVPRGDE